MQRLCVHLKCNGVTHYTFIAVLGLYTLPDCDCDSRSDSGKVTMDVDQELKSESDLVQYGHFRVQTNGNRMNRRPIRCRNWAV